MGKDISAPFLPLLAMKSKLGELDALRQSDTERLRGVAVMVELLDSVDIGRGLLGPKIVSAACNAVNVGNPLWIDTTWLTPKSPMLGVPGGPFEHLDSKVQEELDRDGGLLAVDLPPLIPVIPPDAGQTILRWITMLREHHRRPIVVRSRRDPVTARSALIDQLDRIARLAKTPFEETHLVLDEGYVPAVARAQAESLVETINSVAAHGDFASIGLLAGSAPQERREYDTRLRDRPELELWKAVTRMAEVPARYGDYGVIHPVPPAADGGYGWPNPYIHYTVPGGSLFIARRIPDRGRGAPPEGSTEEYFLKVAEELAGRPEFAGRDFSWGDRELYDCRNAFKPKVGRAPRWISMATSHHIAHLAHGADRTSD